MKHALTHIKREKLKITDILSKDGERRIVEWMREMRKLREKSRGEKKESE